MYLQVIPIKQPASEGRSQTQSLWLSLFPPAADVWRSEYTFDVLGKGGVGGWLFTQYKAY